MKPFTIFTFLFACVFALSAQTIRFNLDKLEDPPMIIEKSKLESATSVKITLLGTASEGCQLILGTGEIISCDEIKNTSSYSINKADYSDNLSIQVVNSNSASESLILFSTPQKTPDGAGNGGNEPVSNIPQHIITPLIWSHALAIDKALKKKQPILIDSIIAVYKKDTLSFKVFRALNPFLKEALPAALDSAQQEETPSSSNSISAQAGGLFNGGIGPDIALEALSGFIKDRLVAELNRKYLTTFRSTLDSSQEMKSFLPVTQRYLTNENNFLLDYRNTLPSLRQTLFEDLDNMPKYANDFLVANKDPFVQENNLNEFVLLQVCFKMIEQIKDKAPIEDVIGAFATNNFNLTSDDLESGETDMASWTRFIGIVSNHLRVGPFQSGSWIQGADIKSLFAEPRPAFLFLGLLLEYEKDTLKNLKISNSGGKENLYDFLTDTKNPKNAKICYEIIDVIYKIAALEDDPGESFEDKVERAIQLAKYIISIYSKIPNVNQDLLKIPEECIGILNNLYQKRYVAALSEILLLFKMDDSKLKPLIKYISFCQSIIDAKTKEELVAILEEVADPVGSYEHKRSYPLTISISSFPGLGGGYEARKLRLNDSRINNFGFTAPIGLAVSFSRQKEERTTSWTLFAPIIDVGALTSFRLLDDTISLPKFDFENFISPGLFLQIGFKNSPISIYGGFQLSPEVVSITADMVEVELRERFPRFNVGVSADLHLLSIFNKSRKTE